MWSLLQKGIDDIAQHYLAKAGIYAARRVKKSDMEKLARATGAKITDKSKGNQRIRSWKSRSCRRERRSVRRQ